MGLDIHRAALGGWLPGFVRVSNRMAGINRDPTVAEISAHRGLFATNALRVENLEVFVHHIAPGASLRAAPDPKAADQDAAASAARMREDLAAVILAARTRSAPSARLHRIYRHLRPFTGGNGRCGRALWMWQVMRGTREELAAITELDLSDAAHPLNADALPVYQ